MKFHPLLERTERGLYCPPADVHIDPWKPVSRAIITHAHSDHARPGSAEYLAHHHTATLLRLRLGYNIAVQPVDYGTPQIINGVRISLHPAGHVLGAAQVRLEHKGAVAVVSGDYKTQPDPTCAPFEPLTCDAFVTEATFALPIYRWPNEDAVFAEIDAWWSANQSEKTTSVIYAYTLGKAQRVLAGLDAKRGPILLHGAVQRIVDVYHAAGVMIPPTLPATAETAREHRGRAIVIAPPSAAGSTWIRKFRPASTAFVSGWMQIRGTRRRRNVDRGFVLSDHADWDGVLQAIAATRATRIGVTHGYVEPFARFLREERQRDAVVLPTHFEGESPHPEPEPDDDPQQQLHISAPPEQGA